MKKFKYKKSKNEEILQPIVKVVQEETNEDKHYYDKSKYGLINYLKSEAKEGKVKLYENGRVEDEDGLKHIIISPCRVEAWEKLDEEEKFQMRERFISKLKFDFKDKNYLLAIEKKNRKNSNGVDIEMEHYHLVVSNKTPTDRPFKVTYKKNLMSNYIENFTEVHTRKKLGVKTFNEIKESKIKKLKSNFENKSSYLISKSEINTLHAISSGIFEERKYSLEFNTIQKHFILSQKKNLLIELSEVKKSMKNTLVHIQTINDSIQSLKEYKHTFVSQYLKELGSYRNNCFKQLKDYSLYVNYEHTFFTKLQENKLKNGVINLEEFLTSIARSKNYWQSEKVYKRRQIEEHLRFKQEELNFKVRTLDSELISLFESKNNQDKLVKFFSEKINIKKYLISNNSLQKISNEQILGKKLEIYSKYLSFVKEEINSKKRNMSQRFNPLNSELKT